MADFHSALRNETIGTASAAGVGFALVRHQHSKTDFETSIHAAARSFTFSGLQTWDLLGWVGFRKGADPCSFLSGSCVVRKAPQEFDLADFARAFQRAYDLTKSSLGELGRCGFHFSGKSRSARGDGHRSPQSDRMKHSEDEFFRYVFTWIAGGADKGWTTHYRPVHTPVSPELRAVLQFLRLAEFGECPEFEFETCYWRHLPHEDRGDSLFGGNADAAHSWFDSHAEHFAPGVRQLIEADAELRAFRMGFLDIPARSWSAVETKAAVRAPSSRSAATPEMPRKFDVAISFAGPQRDLAQEFATILRDAGFTVFYDNFYPAQLWGKDLPSFFDAIYRLRSRYCVIFVSQDYLERPWTNHERKSAVARAIEEKGEDYILPIRLDDAELPGIAPTIGYLRYPEYSVGQLAAMACTKLRPA